MRVVELTVPVADVEIATDRLWCAGAQAVEECEPSGGLVRLRTVLAADHQLTTDRLGPLGTAWLLAHIELDDEPAQTWRAFATPIRVSPTLMVVPAWQPLPGDEGDAVTVLIEPGAAFGLGDHPTTRLAAAATERLVPVSGSVLDVGCGTGVLAVIAARLGAAHVLGIDIADAAVEATIDNARRNSVADAVEASSMPVESVEGVFDLVLANILAPALVAMAPSLRRVTAPHGTLVISGVLDDGFDHVVAALQPMRVDRVERLEGWAAVELRHIEE
ncbi:MAG TPA: 50S ribosomal protein L11 methyltransferase [Ilumatobacter sp.]|nr:50S ribosomal protein L11 methyltransferase [Ilumatobacter sp.]